MSYGTLQDGRVYCKWYEGKKQKIEYFGHGDLALALAKNRDEQIKRDRGKLKADGGITIAQLCQKYANQHPVESSTSQSDDYRFSSVILPLLGNILADGMTSEQINEYVSERIAAGRKRGTIDRELDLLKSVFSWGEAQTPPLIYRNIIRKYKFKYNDKDVPAPPNTEEMALLIKHSPPHLKRAMMLLWYQGMRPGGELLKIKWSDVDLVSDQIRIVAARKGGSETRYVPIQDPIRPFLLAWRAEDEIDLKTSRAKIKPPIHNLSVVHRRFKTIQSLKRAWKETKERARFYRRLRLYDIRHAFATYILLNDGDLKALSEVMGHSRVDTTMNNYQHVSRGQHRTTIAKMPSILVETKLKKVE